MQAVGSHRMQDGRLLKLDLTNADLGAQACSAHTWMLSMRLCHYQPIYGHGHILSCTIKHDTHLDALKAAAIIDFQESKRPCTCFSACLHPTTHS